MFWNLAVVICLLGPASEGRQDATRPTGTGDAGVQETTTPPASQPVQNAGAGRSGRRMPTQILIMKQLIAEQERRRPIIPPSRPGRGEDGDADGAQKLLVEGTTLTNRQGRLIREAEGSFFEFAALEGEGSPRRLQINRNGLLELMEELAAGGTARFTVSAEVSVYRGRNYLLIRHAVLRVGNGNISP